MQSIDMKTKMQNTRGFTLVEILTVLAIIGVLATLLTVGGPKVLSMARVSTAQGDIRNMKTAVADAATKLGGTLPLTEGITTVNSSVASGTNLLTSTGANFSNAARLEQVLMAVPQPLIETYFRPSFGSQVFSRSDGATASELTFNSTTNVFSNSPDLAATTGMSYANVTRLECRAVNAAATPGTDGSNFRIDGINNLASGRVAYILYKNVPGVEAYNLALKVNGTSLMSDASGAGTTAQTQGTVTYAAASGGVTDVYVYLANF